MTNREKYNEQICDSCNTKFFIEIPSSGRALPTPNELTFAFAYDRSWMWVKKYTICPECQKKVENILKEKFNLG